MSADQRAKSGNGRLRCSNCYGTGKDREHRFVRMVRDSDHLHCDLHGDIGWAWTHGDCPSCEGTGRTDLGRTQGDTDGD